MRQEVANTDFDMSHCSVSQGDVAELKGPKDDFETLVSFLIPPEHIPLGKYEVEHKGSQVGIELLMIETPEQDPILHFGKDWRIGHLQLPFVEFTDNQGKYPYVIALLMFPYRLAEWMDPEHETGINFAQDYDEIAVTGIPKSADKVTALVVLNKFLREFMGQGAVTFKYEDITVFMECYFHKQSQQMPIKMVTYLASDSAYKDVVAPHVLKDFHQSEIKEAVSAIAGNIKSKPINSEDELLAVVYEVIQNVIKHHIENRRWISAFWDSDRTVHVANGQVLVPREPKGETEIQPTLYVLLYETLSPLGIHVVAEPDEGIGKIDFRCLFTTVSGLALSAAIEFKLAHHGNLQNGIRKQLPAYLKATKSQSGIYSVMWFKDPAEKYWKEPRNRTLEQSIEWLNREAVASSGENMVNILTSVIDASVKPSASKLKFV
jgi:hypothetical protein